MCSIAVTYLTIRLLSVLFALTPVQVLSDSSMPIVAEIKLPGSSSDEPLPLGDADRDGKNEFYVLYTKDGVRTLTAFEHIGSNCYQETVLGGDYWPLCLGDADRDGLSDLVFLRDNGRVWLMALESSDPFSLPRDTFRIARDILTGARGMCLISDIDIDSLPEIAIYDDYGIRLYECSGNNRFTQIASLVSGRLGCFCYGDADQDGKPEIVAGSDRGPRLYVFEATGDNQFEICAVCTTDTGIDSALWPAIANDMDGDGKREIIALTGTQDWVKITIFEAAADNHYEQVWTEVVPGLRWTERFVTVGDVDGNGQQEFAISDGWWVRLYRCIGDDQYQEVWSIQATETQVLMCDLNGNGRSELIIKYDHLLVFREYPAGGITEDQTAVLQQVGISPSVVAKGKTIGLDGLPDGTKVEVLDVSGRVVAETERLWNTRSVSPGAYFLRITKGNQSITSKVLVVE